MNISRRSFLGGLSAGAALAVTPGCCAGFCKAARPGKVAVQLYSIRDYIAKVGIEKALADVRAIGFEGVEFAGYWNKKPEELKKILDDNGLIACGTHVGRDAFSPANFKKNCEFNLTFGNKYLCCPGGGNHPPKNQPCQENEDFVKALCEYYNTAAENCAQYGCIVGLHNHTWEFNVKMMDGETYWDRFFKNTNKAVQMEQDVGWTTCAGHDPCEQYKKFPGRSFTLHAKENGMGGNVKKFDAILGQPGCDAEGKPCAVGVDWDKLAVAADKDNVQWWVVECERHSHELFAIQKSFEFLKSKGRI